MDFPLLFMKKALYWIVGIIILLIASVLVYYYFQQEGSVKCEFENSGGCDRSCNIDSDCKFSLGQCVNVNEEVLLENNFTIPAYFIETCACEKNVCVGTPTGEIAI